MLVVGYHLNCLDEPLFIAVSKPLLTEFGIHHRLESCEGYYVEFFFYTCLPFGVGVKNVKGIKGVK